MENYRINKIKENFYSIEQGHVRSFLFVGDKEAQISLGKAAYYSIKNGKLVGY
jgi:hypothetical protein